MRQVHLPPKQPYFRGSLQNSRTEIEYYANFSALSCVKDREFIFCKNSTLLSTLLQKSVFVISAKKNHCLRIFAKDNTVHNTNFSKKIRFDRIRIWNPGKAK